MTCEKILSNFLDCSIYLSLLLFRHHSIPSQYYFHHQPRRWRRGFLWEAGGGKHYIQAEGREIETERMNIFFIYYVVFIYFTCLLTLLLVFCTYFHIAEITVKQRQHIAVILIHTARVLFKVRDSLNTNLHCLWTLRENLVGLSSSLHYKHVFIMKDSRLHTKIGYGLKFTKSG